MDGRKGNWMQTFSGRAFWPMDPRPEEICIEDIAHALSQICRYLGHCIRFQSVAEHSVLLYRAVPQELKRAALMHDSPEAYVVDLPRPIKPFIRQYKYVERDVAEAIKKKYKIDDLYPPALAKYDTRILVDEQQQNMAPPPMPWESADLEPLGVKLEFWSPQVAEIMFLSAFREAFP
jgi:hypothetical protein